MAGDFWPAIQWALGELRSSLDFGICETMTCGKDKLKKHI
jgi:hypothetical protein